MNRKILVILSNRWDRNQKLRFVELSADRNGNVLGERPLRGGPRKSIYDEVWENDQGKRSWAECNRFRRKYPHPLEKKQAPTAAGTGRKKQARKTAPRNLRKSR